VQEFAQGQQFRQIWNFITNNIKSNHFDLLVSSTAMKPGLGAHGAQQVETMHQFSHISFQEYFCSMELLEKIQEEVNNNVSGIEACKRIFLNNSELKGNNTILHNFWWNNVIFCAANAAPTWLFKDMTKFLLMNDDDSASNTTLCYELSRLRGDVVNIPRFRATSRLSSCLIHHCVLIRQCALGEIKISESYKTDVIKDVVRHLAQDIESERGTMAWYEKAAALNSLVCMDR